VRVRVLLGLALLVVAGCSDRYESSYATYADAKSRGALGPGKWLPEFLPRSAREIREEHDIDTNELWVAFTFEEELSAPASCARSSHQAVLDDRAPRWWLQAAEGLGSSVQSYECTESAELGDYWARSDCMLWASTRKAMYRCSPSKLEPKPSMAQQTPAADAGNPRG
jgi:hypothetical protein